MAPRARLAWLDQPADIVNSEKLISVTDKTGRSWFVLNTFAAWRQWSVTDGDRHIARDTSTYLRCLLVAKSDLQAALDALSNRELYGRDLPSLELPWHGFVGEYPWHPVFSDMEQWEYLRDGAAASRIRMQPTVVNYLAERSGHDYSIDGTFNFNLPSPGLIEGMKLRLVDGRRLSYANEQGRIEFYDPTTVEPGPQAALVDRSAFLAFLERNRLAAVWTISGEKNVYGGKPHNGGYGGTRSFASVYWLTEAGFGRKDHLTRRDPSQEQLLKVLAAD